MNRLVGIWRAFVLHVRLQQVARRLKVVLNRPSNSDEILSLVLRYQSAPLAVKHAQLDCLSCG